MKLQIKFKTPGLADFDLTIHAKGMIMTVLYWASDTAPLPGWSSLAAVPIAPSGTGTFRFEGGRSIPENATHIYAQAVTPDFQSIEEACVEIPAIFRTCPPVSEKTASFSLMSDLHLSGKPGKIRKALGMAESSTILLSGDLTNDGFTEQFELFKNCIEAVSADKLILSVTGNHDQLFSPDPETLESYKGYAAFQDYLFQRAETLGKEIVKDASGAYFLMLDDIEIIGLQCVTFYRKFVFPKGTQLKWLEKHLKETEDTKWHIILCHAPLSEHNPQRSHGVPYLSRDHELQQILDTHHNLIFISGHTHVSPNMKQPCVEFIPGRNLLYINDGSVTPTELSGETLMPAEWKDGVIMELSLYEDRLEIRTKSIHTGILYPRGFYIHKINGCQAGRENITL